MVKRPEDFEYSGHRAYLGLDRSGLVDTEPVLRHFGASKKRAIEVYTRFVEASLARRVKTIIIEPRKAECWEATSS